MLKQAVMRRRDVSREAGAAPLPRRVVALMVAVCIQTTLAGAWGTTEVEAPIMAVVNPVKSEGVSVIRPGEPGFAAEVAKFLPGGVGEFRDLLPFFLIVRNDTGGYLAGITVLFTIPGLKMGNGKDRTFRISAHTLLRQRELMFAPGDARLVSPLSEIQATLGAGNDQSLFPVLTDAVRRHLNMFLSFYGKRRMVATVDSIITEDGTLIGPDNGNLLDDLNRRLDAENDLRAAVDSLRGGELKEYLSRLAGQQAPPGDEYRWWQQIQAANFLGDLASGGEAQFVKDLKRRSVDAQFLRISRRAFR